MASLDTLIQDILAPVESAVRAAPKVLAWFDAGGAESDTASPSWDWLAADDLPARGLEVTEHQMPMDVICAVFGLAPQALSQGLRAA